MILDFLSNLLAADNPLWYCYPLVLVIGLVYKATQYDRPKDVALGTLHFFVSVTVFMIVLAVSLYGVSEWL